MAELGQVSLYLVTAAMTAYLIATIAFAVDFSRLAADRPKRARTVRARELVSAGVTDAPSVDVAPTGATDAVDDGAPAVRGRAVGIAMSTFTLGAFLLVAGAATRGIAAGRVPWANMYEFTVASIVVSSALFLGINRRRDVRFLGTFVSLVAVLGLFLALAVLYTEPNAVQPALQSYWLVIHVAIATSSMGVFGVAAVVSGLQLAKERTLARGTSGRIMQSLPTAADLERLAFRINAVGFVLWTFVLISGAIWAEHAWGRYWGWDAKETWSFIIWVVYAAYLHARSTRGWEGRRAAWFSVAGFASILINYYVVNLFVNSLHSYSGV
ncbi:c-type cytochrome biogenesis protein CcsB [Litorihabitans aurantiacus]|uniref:C-type cytochrome biogenesis protein CcsB n=1 Tax=Litorihabitans aurantiacus TaxID=1930061 RepID=A0AA37XGJ2_9MICO|nr:c-type cytochrome biogenesis protein CcsB [Litorihabitans aurantiacus]GMA32405.1 c-type cytochrome biogenesis protein CcsB [Litorihabitans aurantiacus]